MIKTTTPIKIADVSPVKIRPVLTTIIKVVNTNWKLKGLPKHRDVVVEFRKSDGKK
jgi:hypothetical protein